MDLGHSPDTGASEGELRSGYALTPSPSHSKNISLFTERRTSERAVSKDGYSSFLFNPLWGFPVVAAGILFVVDHKALKQNLRVKTFVGTSANALKTQIWTALIALLILKFLQLKATFDWSLSNLAALLRMNLFVHRDLWRWLNQPFKFPPLLPESSQPSFTFS